MYSNVSAGLRDERLVLGGIYFWARNRFGKREGGHALYATLDARFSCWSALRCSGCESGSSENPAPITFTPAPAPTGTGFVALYAPPVDVGALPQRPLQPDGQQLAVPVKVTSPLRAALNTLDGFSTSAVISAPFNAPLDPASLIPCNPLRAGDGGHCIDLRAERDGTARRSCRASHYTVRVSTAAGSGNSVLEIVPLRPLSPRTRYAFIVTNRVRSTAGIAAGADPVFGAVRDAHLAGLTACRASRADAAVSRDHAADQCRDRRARHSRATPSSSRGACRRSRSATCSTPSTTSATPRHGACSPSAGMTTAQLGLGLPGIASIYTGYLEVPYYGDPANPLTSFWVNSQLAAADRRRTRRRCARVPNKRIPLLATLPNAAAAAPSPLRAGRS